MKSKIRFNYVDVIIILLVVVVFVAGFMFVKSGVRSTTVLPEVSFTVEQKQVPENYKDMFSVGDKIYDAIKGDTLGYVTSVEASPATNLVTSANDGTHKIAEYEGKEDVYITIKGTPSSMEPGVIIAQQKIRVGEMIYIKKPGCVGRGYIVKMEIDEQEGGSND